tara:strand:- start:118 stop:351 length:234 start_codon:yes stop_codon:yes gene_type:complete
VLILLSINIKIGTIKETNNKKKKKICVLKNCNKNSNTNANINYPRTIRNEIQNKLRNEPCPKIRTPLNNVYNKFYIN